MAFSTWLIVAVVITVAVVAFAIVDVACGTAVDTAATVVVLVAVVITDAIVVFAIVDVA